MRLFGLLAIVFFIASVPGRGDEMRLEELNLALFKSGWATAQAGKSVKGLPLQMGGKTFANGVGTHAPSLAIVRLDGKASRFQATVGLNDTGRSEPGSVQFSVFGDDKLLFQSGTLHGNDQPQAVDVPLAGVKMLRLEVAAIGSNNYSDHADWADATITYSGRKPELIDPDAEYKPEDLYPPADKLVRSHGNKTYHVDPAKGEDMSKINAIQFAPGDKVIIGPGIHRETLAPSAMGTRENPVVIQFLPGRHEFKAENAERLCYFVSNSADAPLIPRPIGILLKNCRNVQITGGPGSEIWYGDRMTEFINDHSENISYSGLSFDFARPTVSEFRVLSSDTNSVVIQVAEGSTYSIENGRFAWTGDLGTGWTMAQQADPETGQCGRMNQWNPFASATAEDMGGGKVRLGYKSSPGMTVGHQFQFRNVNRDNTSAVNTRCKDIAIRDCNFFSLPGMGIVSQYTENITYQRVNVVPRPGTIRTCPAWADCFHFSGCRGDILVDTCNFSGMQDDAINVHGTHLRILQKTGPNQVLLGFMQPQTYGIAAFQPGDQVEFVNHQTLRGYASNTVAGIERKTDKEWLLTLTQPVADFGENDVVDNVTWYPNVTVRNCTVKMDSCRGFLVTTRGKALIEKCTFIRTAMSAILVEDDAEGWFESGPIRDLTIRNNTFTQCAGPVIWINPHNGNSDPALPVHENIRITDNYFDGGGINAKSVKGLVMTGNRFSGGVSISTAACTEVTNQNNIAGAKN